MPEFILDHGSPDATRTFRALDSFTQGYIEAAFFTNTGDADDAENGLENATFAELAPETLADIVADCAAWQAKHESLLALAYDRPDYSAEQAGRDYWFTRNGHGVGFWDRKQLDANGLSERLSQACRYSQKDMYRGDNGLIYFS